MNSPMTDVDLEAWSERLRIGGGRISKEEGRMLIAELLLWRRAYRRNEKQLTRALQLDLIEEKK